MDFEKLVRDAYKNYLGRDNPDEGGITWWVDQLESGAMSVEALEESMKGASADWEEVTPGVWERISDRTDTAVDEDVVIDNRPAWQRAGYTSARDYYDAGEPDPGDDTVQYTPPPVEDDPIEFDEMELPDTPDSPEPTIDRRDQFEVFVRNQYKSNFDRMYPEQEGVDFWVGELVSGRETYNTIGESMRIAGERWDNTDVGEWTHQDTGQVVYDERPPVDQIIPEVEPPDDPLPPLDIPEFPDIPGFDGPDTPIEEVFDDPIDFDVPDWFKDWEPPDFSEFLKPREFTFDKTTPQQAAILSAPVIGGEREEERKRRAAAKSRFKVNLTPTGVQI